MKRLLFLGLVLCVGTLSLYADEDFDSFDDEEMSFVIKTKKPKIVVKKDSSQKSDTVHFTQEVVGKNKAITMTVKNFVVFEKLKTVDTDYLVMDIALENIMKSQKVIVSNGSNHPSAWVNKSSEDYEYKEAIPMYQIPDVMQHLYLSVNNGAEQAIDMMSLLIDKPLIDYNTNIVEVYPEHAKEGRLAFRLPKNTTIEQLSLHYYDTKYGNIELPIVGEMKEKMVDVTQLSIRAYKHMNDNFSLTVTGYDVKETLGDYQAKEDGTFEVIEIDIQSNVYALLKFNPAERFYLKIGDTYRLKLHPVTQELPMGLYHSASLSPGANNKFRLAFYVPKGMEKFSRSLMVELKGKDILLPVKDGADGIVKQVLSKGSVEGTTLKVNAVYTNDKKMLVDITFEDKEDAYSTRLHDAFYLNEKPEMPNTSSRKMVRDFGDDDIKQSSGMGSFTNNTYKSMYAWYPLSKSSDKIFGYQKQETILDGNKKRVFLWFDNQFSDKYTKPWYLVSPIFKDLKFKIDKEPQPLPKALRYALVKTYPYTPNKDSVDARVLAMVEKFRSQKSKEEKSQPSQQHIASLESKKEKRKFVTIPVMSASMVGAEKLSKVKTLESLLEELTQLQWVPSAYAVTTSLYSTASMLTQGWGTENEMFKAVYDYLKAKDYGVKYGSYTLNEKVKYMLQKEAKNIPLPTHIPFIEWTKEEKSYSLVFPFLKPIDEVQKYIDTKQYMSKIAHKQATIEMILTYMPKNDGTATKSFGMFGGALGGATSTEQRDVIFKKSWNVDEVSDSPIDIYFPGTTAFYTEGNQTLQDKAHALAEKKVEPKVLTINITMPDGKLDTYEHHFKEKQALKDVFFTFALGIGDISKDVLHMMEKKRKKLFNVDEKKMNPFSKLQWANRAKIYKFVAMQTKNENHLEAILGLDAKRNKSPRTMISIIEKIANKKLISSLDLRRVYADVYGAKKTKQSFNIISGLFDAEAEVKAVPKSRGVFEYWKSNMDKFTMLPYDNKETILKWMKDKSVAKAIMERYKKSEKIWLYPFDMKGEKAWFEIDPQNYRIVSVLENGQYGAMTEESILDSILSIAEYGAGLFYGVSMSVMTTIPFSLMMTDTCGILKAAEEVANNIACAVATMQFASSPSIMGGTGTALGCAGKSGASKALSWEEAIGKGLADGKSGLASGLGGFANGFGDGVALYFMDAKASSGCK